LKQSFGGARQDLEREREKVRPEKETGFYPMSVKQAGDAYLQAPKPLLTPREYDRQAGILEHLKQSFHGKIRDISARSVEQYIAVRSRKRSAATIRKEVGVLKPLLNRAVKEGKIPKNPAAGVAFPKAPAGRVRYLQPAELALVLQHCPPWIRPVVLLAVATGMRRSELLQRLRWMDVDLLNGRLTYRKARVAARERFF
jgi:integrase